MSIFLLCIIEINGITESAVRKAENIKNELVGLLSQNTAVMTAVEYANWKKKIDEGFLYLKQTFPLIVQNYERAVRLKEETYQIAHSGKSALSNEVLPLAASVPAVVNEAAQEGIAAFNKALEKIGDFPNQIQDEMRRLELKSGLLPSLYLKWQEVEAVEDFFVELLRDGLINPKIKEDFYAQKDKVVKSISSGVADVTTSVLGFVLTDPHGLNAQLVFTAKLAQIDTLLKLSTASWLDVDGIIQLFLGMNDLLIEGFWQSNDMLITLLPHIAQSKVEGIKQRLNNIVNKTQSNGLPIGLYDQLIRNMKHFLQNVDSIVDSASVDMKTYDLINKVCYLLTDYIACMLEFESIILKHYNQKEIEIASIDSYSADDLIVLLQTIQKKIDKNTHADSIQKKQQLDDLLIIFEAASLAIDKVTNAFINPLNDDIPNVGVLYDQVQKNYDKYLVLIESKKIGQSEQDIFLKEYNATLKELDTKTVMCINKVLSFLVQKENLPDVNTWLKSLVASYAKGVKKINTLGSDSESKFSIYADLIKVLTGLFIKGFGLQGQSVSFKMIVKRGLVDTKIMNECEGYINTLFNVAKDQNGLVKGLVSRAIESIDSLLLLAQEYMSSIDILLVKAYQQQLVPLVALLERLFAMENVLVEPELRKFVLKNIQSPFSNSDILADAKILVDPEHAEQFALKKDTPTNKQAQVTMPSSFAQDVVAVLASIETDIVTKLAALKLPDLVPNFAEQYTHLVDAETLYQDMKKDFTLQEKEDYKAKSLKVSQSIDAAVLQVAFKVAEYLAKKGGLLEGQLAFIATFYISFIKGQAGVLNVENSTAFKAIVADAQKTLGLFNAAFLPLKHMSPSVLQADSIKKNATQLITILNGVLDSSLDVKTKNAPLGLLNKLVATWLAFFDAWQKSVQKLTIDQIKQQQEQLKPVLSLLSCYKDMVDVMQSIAVSMSILHPELSNTFVDKIKVVLDPASAQSLASATVEQSTMQPKQTASSADQLRAQAVTVPVDVATENKKSSSSSNESGKKISPAAKALQEFATLKANFTDALGAFDTSKPSSVPRIQDLFVAIEKVKGSFEFDSALVAISADEEKQVEKVYQEVLLFGFEQSFTIGKRVLEKSNGLLSDITKDFEKILKAYAKDQKKSADITKDTSVKGVIDRIKAIDSSWAISFYQLAELKNHSVEGKVSTLEPFLQQLNILVDNTVKNGLYVGLLNELMDQIQTFFNYILSYMKTLAVDKVIVYQKDLLFLQELCSVVDRMVDKINMVVDGKRITIKKGMISAAFSPLLEKITKKENASQYAKGSTAQVEGDVQRALIPLSEAVKQKK